MKGDVVPDTDHVTRLCGGSHIREDGTVAATAFKPRPGEAYLSVNWLEHLALPDRDAAIAELRRVLAAKRKIGNTARLALFNVGRTRDAVPHESATHIALAVAHEPEANDASHSGLYGVPEDDIIIHELVAATILSVLPAR